MPTDTPAQTFKIDRPGKYATRDGRTKPRWRRVPINGRNGVVGTAKVDADDYEAVSAHRWHLSRGGYAMTNIPHSIGRGHWAMHRLIMGFPKDREVDHKNRVRLDNRRANLRVCESWQNSQNRGESGVSFDKVMNKWRALVWWRGHRLMMGTYVTKSDALRARGQLVRVTRVKLFKMLDEIHSQTEAK